MKESIFVVKSNIAILHGTFLYMGYTFPQTLITREQDTIITKQENFKT